MKKRGPVKLTCGLAAGDNAAETAQTLEFVYHNLFRARAALVGTFVRAGVGVCRRCKEGFNILQAQSEAHFTQTLLGPQKES